MKQKFFSLGLFPEFTICFVVQHGSCDPSRDECVLKQCQHPVISLREQALAYGYTALAGYIDKVRKSKVQSAHRLHSFKQIFVFFTIFLSVEDSTFRYLLDYVTYWDNYFQ